MVNEFYVITQLIIHYQPVQHFPVTLAFSLQQHRVGLAGNQVQNVRVFGDQLLQRFNPDLQALTRSDQAKGSDYLSSGITILLLELLPALRLKDRNAMVNDVGFFGRH